MEGQAVRAAPRLKHQVSIAYSLDVPKRTEKKIVRYRFGTLMDISERGLCFKVPEDLSNGGVINLYLKLSDDSRGIKMLGKIIWTKQDWNGEMFVGVKFIGMLPQDWRELVTED